MFAFTIKEFALSRGIKLSPLKLQRMGIGRTTAKRLLSGEAASISLAHLEILCIILHCTPMELLRFVPDPQAPLGEQHPLSEWATPSHQSAFDALVVLSPAQLAQATEYIRRLAGK